MPRVGFENEGIMESLVPTFLILLLVIPAVAAVVAAALGPDRRPAVRAVSLAAVLANLLLTILILVAAVPRLAARADGAATFRPDFATAVDLLPLGGPGSAAIQFFVGLDGLNVWLVALTSVLMLPSVLIGWEAVKERAN